VERQESPRVDLDAIRAAGHGGDVVAALQKGPRQRARRSLRAFGELSCEWAADVPTALDIFDELVDLHQLRWLAAGHPGAFGDSRVVGFHRALVADLLPRGEVLLFRVRDRDGSTVGCLYSYLDANRVLFYQGGFAQDADNKRRPGLTTHVTCLQACSDRGFAVYDLLAGASRYKRELATSAGELVWATAGPLGLRDGRRMLKRLVRGPRAA
jgi:CelD/BcsL family acetyltransferase involved in cellulose biosynthesis